MCIVTKQLKRGPRGFHWIVRRQTESLERKDESRVELVHFSDFKALYLGNSEIYRLDRTLLTNRKSFSIGTRSDDLE